MVPLPAGDWYVFRIDEGELRVTNPVEQHQASKTVDIHLVQRVGNQLAMVMRVQALKEALPGRLVALHFDNPCKREDTLYRNPYDSGGTVVNCLLVNHLVRYLRTASKGVFADMREWLGKEGVELPWTMLNATFAQNQPRRYLTVHITINPGLRGLESTASNWVSNPFHRTLIGRDEARDRYVKEFIAWSEAYKPLLAFSRTAGSGAATTGPVPAFK